MIYKWGLDGSSGQSMYKQNFESSESDDKNVYAIFLVPLRLYFTDDEKNTIIWQNPKPSSTRFCRPIKFLFKKETPELILQEHEKIRTKISQLENSIISIENKKIFVNHILVLTMLDGKSVNTLTGNNCTQKCPMCQAKPSEMNQFDLVYAKPIINKEFLSLGISPLHCLLRSFELLLHISYRLDIKEWQVRGSVKKEIVKKRKESVQKKLREALGILVDIPVEGGSGNTNDGNTARIFYHNYQKSAVATGICPELIRRFSILCRTICSTREVDANKFDEYAKETAKLYIEKYPWYYMSASVHKMLCHGKDLIENALLPIGQFSEEAQEARFKEFRQYRRSFSRKTSRIDSNMDIFNHMLLSSDPMYAIRNLKMLKTHEDTDEEINCLLK